jgi:hypothetical protein
MDENEKVPVNLQELLEKAFFTNGRLFHHERVLCWFPKYFQLYTQTQEQLME